MSEGPQLDLFGEPVPVLEVAAEPEDAYPGEPEAARDVINAIVDAQVYKVRENMAANAAPPLPAPNPFGAEVRGELLASIPRAEGDRGVAAIDQVQDHFFPELRVATSSLEARLVVPPFSILDTTASYWQARKRAWLGLGIQSELGRGTHVMGSGNGGIYGSDTAYSRAPVRSGGTDLYGSNSKYRNAPVKSSSNTGATDGTPLSTSVFDPVLCEVMYRWFCPPDGAVLDCFAGGSVRGVVAGMLQRGYFGVDLSEAQVAANREQWASIAPGPAEVARVSWAQGDSRHLEPLVGNRKFDMVFTCPPYYNLERYSDDAADLSNAPTWAAFVEAYAVVVRASLELLRQDRFAVWVVGNLRDQTGHLLDLVGATIFAHEQCGARLYNDAILATSFGTLPMRTAHHFPKSRKLGRRHQVVLVFWHGNPAQVAEHVQPIEGWEASALVPAGD